MPGRSDQRSSASIEAQCFRSTSDSPLRGTDPVGRSATALNQLASRMALKSQLPEIQYRVSVHGTLAPKGIPAFHTQNRLMLPGRAPQMFAQKTHRHIEQSTGVSYTNLPASGSPLYRGTVHGTTGRSYTKLRGTTGGPYTVTYTNQPILLVISRANYTKLSSTNHNNRAVVFLGNRGGVQ